MSAASEAMTAAAAPAGVLALWLVLAVFAFAATFYVGYRHGYFRGLEDAESWGDEGDEEGFSEADEEADESESEGEEEDSAEAEEEPGETEPEGESAPAS